MSEAFMNGLATLTRIPVGVTRLPLGVVQFPVNLNILGDTFQPTDAANYRLEVIIEAIAVNSDVQFNVQLFNETTLAVVQQFQRVASNRGSPENHDVIFSFVANGVDFYSIRVSVPNNLSGDQQNLMQFTSPNFRADLAQFGGGGTVGPGTVNRIAKFTGANAVGDSNISDDGTMVNVASNARVIGDLQVTGNIVAFDVVHVNIEDNTLYLNNGYVAPVGMPGGLAVNYLPTATADTVAAGGFTAGVPAVSNPTVRTVGAATFAVGNLIQISQANNPENNGLFEVLSHAASVLTIRGVGTVLTVESFTQNQFVTDATVAGAITRVNVSVLRAGAAGTWEQGQGSATPVVFAGMMLGTGTINTIPKFTAPGTLGNSRITDDATTITFADLRLRQGAVPAAFAAAAGAGANEFFRTQDAFPTSGLDGGSLTFRMGAGDGAGIEGAFEVQTGAAGLARLRGNGAGGINLTMEGNDPCRQELNNYTNGLAGPTITMNKARGTIAVPTDIQTNNQMGGFFFGGYQGGSFATQASINVEATENWGGAARGTRIEFSTTVTGTAANNVKLTLDGNGGVTFGDTAVSPDLRYLAGAAPAAFANTVGAGIDVYWRTQGALAASGLRGGDFVVQVGAGDGGARDGKFVVNDPGGEQRFSATNFGAIEFTVEFGRNTLGIARDFVAQSDVEPTVIAPDDQDGLTIIMRTANGGVATAGSGYAGGYWNLRLGDGSDATVASGFNGGDGGSLTVIVGEGGLGDGAGLPGMRGSFSVPGIGGSGENYGWNAIANGINALAVGSYAEATGANATAIGGSASATGVNATAIRGTASADNTLAIGNAAQAVGTNAVAISGVATANCYRFGPGGDPTATGQNCLVAGGNSLGAAFSADNNAVFGNGSANSLVDGTENLILGSSSAFNLVGGAGAEDGDFNTIVGNSSGNFLVSGHHMVIVGHSANTGAATQHGVHIGHTAVSFFDYCVLVGSTSQGLGANSVSVGYGALGSASDVSVGYLCNAGQGSGNTFIGSNAGIGGTGTNNVVMGSSAFNTAWTTGSSNVILGTSAANAISTGSYNVILGESANGAGDTENSVLIGYQASTGVSSTSTIVIGAGSGDTGSTGAACVIVGTGSATSAMTGSANTVLGSGSATACARAYQNVFVGAASGVTLASGYDCTIVGTSADVTAANVHDTVIAGASATGTSYTVVLGSYAQALHGDVVCLGYGSTSTAINQFVCGSSNRAITDIYFGEGVTNATPPHITYHGTGGSGTDIAGGNLTVAGGESTGTGLGGAVIFKASNAAATGAGANAGVEVGRFVGNETVALGDGDYSAGFLTLRSVQANTAATSPVTVNVADSNRVYTNEGAVGAVQFNLPAAQVGLTYTFVVQAAQTLTVDAGAGDTIRLAGSVSAASGNCNANNVGNVVVLVAINATEWVATSIVGQWNVV